MKKSETVLGETIAVLYTIYSVCVPLGVFLTKLFHERKEEDRKRLEESKTEDSGSAEKGEKVASATAPELLLRQKEDYLTCTVQAASLLLKNKECIAKFQSRFKEEYVRLKKEQLGNEGMTDECDEYRRHITEIEG